MSTITELIAQLPEGNNAKGDEFDRLSQWLLKNYALYQS
jgi:hypothetical protein